MTAAPIAARLTPREVARSSGSNFLLSFVFMAPGRRRALVAVYAFCRVVDDAVDLTGTAGSDEAERHLSFWEDELDRAFEGRPSTPIGFALHRAADRFALDKQHLVDVCRGVRMDVDPPEYETFADLELYMFRVASAVGLACLPIFGADPQRSRPYAEALGRALQYTNILRDLAEDGDDGRCYVPNQILAEHGVAREWLCSSPPRAALAADGPIARMLSAESERARGLFATAGGLLPNPDRRALRPARIMGGIYRDLLERVVERGPSVLLPPRVRVPLRRKLCLALSGI